MGLHHRIVVGALATLMPLLAACQGPQQRLADANRAYQSEDWTKAYAEADVAQRELEPPAKQEAAFIAGMAAFRQGRMSEASSRFTVAEGSSDAEVSGKSKAMLGHILEKDGKLEAAATKYDEAAAKLTGDAAEKARAEAADARARATPQATTTVAAAEPTDEPAVSPRQAPAKKPASTKPKSDAASKGKSSAKPAAKADEAKASAKSGSGKSANAKTDKDGDKTSTKGLTIQCGAYPQEAQARKRAKDLADDAKRAGLPAPKVTRVTGRDGKRLWIVSIGSFTSRDAAKKALAKLKIDHAEVLPATE